MVGCVEHANEAVGSATEQCCFCWTDRERVDWRRLADGPFLLPLGEAPAPDSLVLPARVGPVSVRGDRQRRDRTSMAGERLPQAAAWHRPEANNLVTARGQLRAVGTEPYRLDQVFMAPQRD